MISSDFDITGLSLLCNLDSKLAALNRELRFIARTLARLRHRHHAVLVFSPTSKQRSSQQSLQQTRTLPRRQTYSAGDLPLDLSLYTADMLKRLFLTPRKERFDDIESAPVTPVEEEPPSRLPPPPCLTPGLASVEEGRRDCEGGASPGKLELDLPTAPRRRKPVATSRPMSYGGPLTAPPWDHSRRSASFPK